MLDYDEAKEVVEALSYMANMSTKMAKGSVEYTEVIFRTKGDFNVGFYQQGVEQTAFVGLSRYGEGATAFIKKPQIQELQGLIEAAIKKLQTLGAE